MESALCSVAQDGSTSLFIYTRNTASFVYCPPRYVHSDFHIAQTRVGAVLDLPDVPKQASLYTDDHKQRVHNALPEYLTEIDFPEAKSDLIELLSTSHPVISLPNDPLGSTTLIEHHIPLQDNT